jgi:hypothetical protein
MYACTLSSHPHQLSPDAPPPPILVVQLHSDAQVSALQVAARDKYILRLPTDCGDADCLPGGWIV